MARDKYFQLGRMHGGFCFYPYQITLGISLRYWPCIFMPSLRVHFLCFKFWVGVQLKEAGE